ncbi:methylated-DNA--[protein]-cysteine S-methyltransferase [Floccifex sp.]|uniref:methylated-DNA--[protein]-cysteine S-methyltransferase n=1 Tax=Floccifex sp. TaxID=2815810 RepID=UPI003F043A9B
MRARSYTTKYGIFTLFEENHFLVAIKKGNHGNDESHFLDLAFEELYAYFEEKRTEFDIPIRITGSLFQRKVLKEVFKIPYGQTKTYQDIAKAIGNPNASQAVGNAIHNNPLPFVIPCHRVIGKDGSLKGYALGLELKKQLLEMEKLNAK